MSRFRVRLAVVVAMTMTALAVPGSFTTGGGVANAAPILGGVHYSRVYGHDDPEQRFTLTADCGEVTTSLTVPAVITTVDGGGHTISATDLPASSLVAPISSTAGSSPMRLRVRR